ncbi:MAG TPA: ABC transporter permease [Mycobacteriales bacterium]|nr:ABC transporter permease [Mycobacteriales bacterium]
MTVASEVPGLMLDIGDEAGVGRKGRLWRRRGLLIGLTMLVVALVVTIGAPLFAKDTPTAFDALHPLAKPFSTGHLLGTDQYGRDILSRVLYGGRVDLAIAFGATSVTLVFGSIVGLVAGYFGGWVDTVLMRIVDLFFAFPFFVLVIAIVAVLGPSTFNMFIAIWLTSWVSYARIMRAQTVVTRRQQYVLAARALGYGRLRIIFRHILPNVVTAVLVFSMVDAMGNIILAASLSFLGLGVQAPAPEWGAMISDGQNYLLTSWWLALIPGVAIVWVGIGFSLIGDGLADVLRPGGE